MLRAIPARKRVFGAGAHVQVRITAPAKIGKAAIFTIRSDPRQPLQRTGCIALGSTTIQRPADQQRSQAAA